MAGKYTLEQFEADKAAREEREARAEEARRERAEKGSARQAWIRDGPPWRDRTPMEGRGLCAILAPTR